MFFLKIDRQNNSISPQPEGGRSQLSIREFHYDNLHIIIGTDAFTTVVNTDKKILITTGIDKPSMSKEMLSSLEIAPANYLRLVENSVDTLVFIDLENNSLSMVRSISFADSLYYARDNTTFYSASSIPLLKQVRPRFELDTNVLPEYYAYRTLLAPGTLVKDVYKLNGGELIRISLTDFTTQKQHNYTFTFSDEQTTIPLPEVTERVNDILEHAINPVFEKENMLSILLSGGLDSSAIAAIARHLKETVTSFSSDFSFLNKNDREATYALTVAEQLQIKHTVCPTNEEAYLHGLVDSIATAGEPLHHLQTVCLSLLFQNCSSDAPSYFLCGEGADALFGNTLHGRINRFHTMVHYLQRYGKHSIIRGICNIIGQFDSRFRFFSYNFTNNYDDSTHILWTISLFGDRRKITELMDCAPEDIITSRRTLLQQYSKHSLMNQVTILSMMSDIGTTLPLWGRLAAANGIQLVYPYMVPQLIDYITSVPWKVKSLDLKIVIKELLRKYHVPEQLINRPKLSFGFPICFWALPGTMFQPLVDIAGELYDRSFLQSLQKNEMGKAMLLWNMINLHLWKKIFVDNISPADIKEEITDRRLKLKRYLDNYSSIHQSYTHSRYAAILRKTVFPHVLKRDKRASSLRHWQQLEKSQYWSRQRLLDYQWERLKTILTYAYKHTSYYKKIFDEYGLTPESFRTFEDITKLPILTKDVIYKQTDNLISRQFTEDEVLTFPTGGTTGRQVIMYRNRESYNIKLGLAWRHEGWTGRKPCEKLALFWPASADLFSWEPLRSKIKGRYFLRETLYKAGSLREDTLQKTYKDLMTFRPKVLKVFPSALFRFCEFIRKNNLPPPPIRGIMSTGETLYNFQREIFEEIFNCEVFDMYGSREVGNTACECNTHEGLHIAMETQHVEFVENGKPVQPGEEGDIVITDLTNFAMPMIRYQIDDRGSQLPGYCSCGRNLTMMSPAIGRLSDDFWSPDGTRHSGLVLGVHILTARTEIAQMQIIQKTLHNFIVRLVNNPRPGPGVFDFIKQQMKDIISEDINVTIELVEKLPQEKSGKTRFVICEIDPPHSQA